MVTAGPTREEIDPVRFISNHSSGKMGYAMAKGCPAARGTGDPGERAREPAGALRCRTMVR